MLHSVTTEQLLPHACKRTRGRVVWMFICVFVDTEMSSLSGTGQHMSSTYYVQVTSTCLTNESLRVLQDAALLNLLFNIGDLYQKNYFHHSISKSRAYGFAY